MARFNSAGVSQGTFATKGIHIPGQIAFSPTNGDLYVANRGTDEIRRYSGTDGSFVSSIHTINPVGITFNAFDDLFVTNDNGGFTGTISRFNSDGVSLGTFVTGLGDPSFLTTAANGDIFVSLTNNHQIIRVNGTTGSTSVFATTNLFQPVGLAFGPDGNLYVGNLTNIMRYDGTTGAFLDMFASQGLLGNPYGIAFTPDGRLLVTDRVVIGLDTNVIAIDSTGTKSVFATGPRFRAGIAIRSVGSAAAPEPATFALLALGTLTGSIVTRRKA